MGLDMYLTGSMFLSEHFDKELTDKVNKIKEVKSSGFKVGSLEFKIMYWRKANAIHEWFVQECQNGVDECQLTYVENSKLETLVELCKKALANKEDAKNILCPKGGFFFGDTEINDYYFQDLEDTIKGLEKFLKSPLAKKVSVHYQSSW